MAVETQKTARLWACANSAVLLCTILHSALDILGKLEASLLVGLVTDTMNESYVMSLTPNNGLATWIMEVVPVIIALP